MNISISNASLPNSMLLLGKNSKLLVSAAKTAMAKAGKPVAIGASVLATTLGADQFINRTKTNPMKASGHWEYRPPMDGSDYPKNVWVEDPPRPFYGSGGDE